MLDLRFSFGYHGGGDDRFAEATKLEPADQGSVVGRIYSYQYHGDGDSSEWHQRIWLVGGSLKTEECTLQEYLVVPEIVDTEECGKAHTIYQGILKAREDKKAEERYLRERVNNSYPARGDLALVIANTGCGHIGRVFWLGVSADPFGRNAKTRLGVAPSTQSWTKAWREQENPVWTAQNNCITIPDDVSASLEPGDAGFSSLGRALAFLLEYVEPREEQIRRVEVVLGNPELTAKFRLLGHDLKEAQEALIALTNTRAADLPTNPATGKRWVKKALRESHQGVVDNIRKTMERWVTE